MTDLNLKEFLPYQLAVLSAKISQEFSEIYQDRFGITIPEWRILAHLSQQSEPLSVREIHKMVHMDKSKISRAAARLEKRGLINKLVSETDRRLVELSLTPDGRTMIDEITPLALEYEEAVLASLGDSPDSFRKAIADLLAARDAA
ncbi:MULTISPECIES: MarR family winged helix-turn-helix transcriptional regulator [Halocynthiibacter]|uniref:MarR family transcriptional regulator n=1 Tax=Halocynthiibacter halioticoli TaxID=2986804 RepID=A0AAE3IWJ0_9RHOB|nr:MULTISPECIES: MarR family transcriptional regulator [Halocynthiibacter]MCV6823024.1 MarR family transcriptional regulator [Halocynthiibacter halioticoli]MCW4056025.1 MarR family transcriptional regulator [Halocynthiibacter sp. SDUM655004]MDE0591405.1 MarR family transcriptional regulator [Halocynthiibacter sp. C4]